MPSRSMSLCWCTQSGARAGRLLSWQLISCESIDGQCWKHLSFWIQEDLIWKSEALSSSSYNSLSNVCATEDLALFPSTSMIFHSKVVKASKKIFRKKKWLLGTRFWMHRWVRLFSTRWLGRSHVKRHSNGLTPCHKIKIASQTIISRILLVGQQL